jgi:hypothetical protein
MAVEVSSLGGGEGNFSGGAGMRFAVAYDGRSVSIDDGPNIPASQSNGQINWRTTQPVQTVIEGTQVTGVVSGTLDLESGKLRETTQAVETGGNTAGTTTIKLTGQCSL